tara:strand:+ start:121 stop:801 length:681 start_codon:yes stop_codon:yes gene_type:complete
MEKLIPLLFFAFSFSDTTDFMVSFMGLDAAKVSISVKESFLKSKTVKSIIYETKTISSAKTFFPIDNYYKTIINPDFSQILYFEKSTSQPWLKNNLKTIVNQDNIYYSDSKIEILKGYHNIFTLLELVNHFKVKDLINKQFYIDREGQRYTASFINGKLNNDYVELFLNIDLIEDDINPVLNSTDIFTWAVFREDAKRLLRIKDGKLIYCEFSLGLIKMKAEIIKK